MAETIGDLSVDLRLASAKFEQGVGRVNKRMDGMQRQAEKASRVFRGLLAIGGGVAFSGMIKGSIDAANRLGDLSDRLGVSVESMSRLEYAAKKTGVEQRALTTGIQRMTRRVSEAAEGTGAAVGALDELGLSAEELNKLAPEEQFMRLADALEAVPNQADKVRLGMKLLDSEGVALLQTMKGGSDAIKQLGEESDKTGNTITSKFAAKATQANAAIIKMKGSAQGLTNEMAVSLAPAIETAATWMAENAESVRNGAIAFVAITGAIKAASVAQASFNAVARLNPYIALATAVGIATAAIYEFATAQSQAEDRVVTLWESAQGSSAAYMAAQSKINESQAVHDKLVKQQSEKQAELNRLREDGFKKYSSDGNRARELEKDIADIVERRTRLTDARIAADKAESARRKKRQDEEKDYLNRINDLLNPDGKKTPPPPKEDISGKLQSDLDKQFAIRMKYRERISDIQKIYAAGEIDLARKTELEKLAVKEKADARSAAALSSANVTPDNDPLMAMIEAQERGAAIRKQMEEDAAAAYESIRESVKTQEEAENERYQSRMDRLQMFLEFNKDKQEEVNSVMEREQKRHQNKMAAIEEARFKQQLQGAQMAFGNLSSLMNTESRKLFEIGKVAAIAEATIAGIEASIHSYKFGAKIGGPALGAAFAATAAVATGVKISQLKSQQFGGGGTVAAGGSGAGPGTYQPSQPQIPSEPVTPEGDKRGVQIVFNGDVNGLDADQIARSIKDHLDSTDFVLVEPASRNGRALKSA